MFCVSWCKVEASECNVILSMPCVQFDTHPDTIAQGKDPVNFDIEDFDPVKIRASASTLDEFVAGMRKQKGPRSSR